MAAPDVRRQWAEHKSQCASEATKALYLLALLHKDGRLSRSQLTALKDLVVMKHESVGYVLQVFELMDDDFDELEDNFKHLCNLEVAVAPRESQPAVSMSHYAAPSSYAQATPSTSNLSGDQRFLSEPGWLRHLAPEFAKPYFHTLQESVEQERRTRTVYPPPEHVYSAFNHTPLDKVKVVILGQDPYFNEGQAHGLAFSVNKGVPVPPSLKNIYAELERTIPGWRRPNHGCLTEWADRGVLLLNATLTVRASEPNAHAKLGWQTFTDEVIRVLNKEQEGLVYLLWGEFAQKKGRLVDESRHRVLRGAHPSPLSRGFVGCNHFAECNQLLLQMGKTPIDWSLSP